MGQDKHEKIVELERKFQELAESGHPNVIDNGFFLDAVFNVTAVLKKVEDDEIAVEGSGLCEYSKNVEVLEDLYKSLKAFERLYTDSLRIPQI